MRYLLSLLLVTLAAAGTFISGGYITKSYYVVMEKPSGQPLFSKTILDCSSGMDEELSLPLIEDAGNDGHDCDKYFCGPAELGSYIRDRLKELSENYEKEGNYIIYLYKKGFKVSKDFILREVFGNRVILNIDVRGNTELPGLYKVTVEMKREFEVIGGSSGPERFDYTFVFERIENAAQDVINFPALYIVVEPKDSELKYLLPSFQPEGDDVFITFAKDVRNLLEKNGFGFVKNSNIIFRLVKGRSECGEIPIPYKLSVSYKNNTVTVTVNDDLYQEAIKGDPDAFKLSIAKIIYYFFTGQYDKLVFARSNNVYYVDLLGGENTGKGNDKNLVLLLPCEESKKHIYIFASSLLPNKKLIYTIPNFLVSIESVQIDKGTGWKKCDEKEGVYRCLNGKINLMLGTSTGLKKPLTIEVRPSQDLNNSVLLIIEKTPQGRIIHRLFLVLPSLSSENIKNALLSSSPGQVPINLRNEVKNLLNTKYKNTILPTDWEKIVSSDCAALPVTLQALRTALREYDEAEEAKFAVCLSEELRSRLGLKGSIPQKCYGTHYMDREVARKITDPTILGSYSTACTTAMALCYIPLFWGSLGAAAPKIIASTFATCIGPLLFEQALEKLLGYSKDEVIVENLKSGSIVSRETFTSWFLSMYPSLLYARHAITSGVSFEKLALEAMDLEKTVIGEKGKGLKAIVGRLNPQAMSMSAKRAKLLRIFRSIYGVAPSNPELAIMILRDPEAAKTLYRLKKYYDAVGDDGKRAVRYFLKALESLKNESEVADVMENLKALSGVENVVAVIFKPTFLNRLNNLEDATMEVRDALKGTQEVENLKSALKETDVSGLADMLKNLDNEVDHLIERLNPVKQVAEKLKTKIEELKEKFNKGQEVKDLGIKDPCPLVGVFAGTATSLHTVHVNYKTLTIYLEKGMLNIGGVEVPLVR